MGNIYIYQTSPNQRSVITHKTLSDKEHPYGICNITAALTAAKELTDRAYKLYIRMSLHQDGHTYALSPIEINNSIGMTDKRYREAVKELIDKGYLVQHQDHRNVYTFYEAPAIDNVSVLPNEWDYPPKTERTAIHNDCIEQPIWEVKPSVSEGEIIDNITSQIYNNTANTTLPDLSLIPKKEKNSNDSFPILLDDEDEELPF